MVEMLWSSLSFVNIMFNSVDNMTMKTKHIKTMLRGVLISNNTDIVAKYTEYIYCRRSNHEVTPWQKSCLLIFKVSCVKRLKKVPVLCTGPQ